MNMIKYIAFLTSCVLCICPCAKPQQAALSGSFAACAQLQTALCLDVAHKPEESAVFGSVLSDSAAFLETGIGEKIQLSDLSRAVSPDPETTLEIPRFTVMDLDADGKPEVVLFLRVNGNDFYGCEILHAENNEVYGYCLPYRAFNNLKEDGTFTFSGGAANSGVATIKFENQTCYTNELARSDVFYTASQDPVATYFVNGQPSSQEAFQAEMARQEQKEDAVQYDFTDENIRLYIP